MDFKQARAAADKWYREQAEAKLKHIQMHRIIDQRKRGAVK